MPRIDFRCRECNQEFYEYVAYDKRHEVVCPHCQSPDIQQVFKGKFYGTTSSRTTVSGSGFR